MSKDKQSQPRTFRPWPDNAELLKVVEDMGLSASAVINEVLEEHLKSHLEGKARRMSKTFLAAT